MRKFLVVMLVVMFGLVIPRVAFGVPLMDANIQVGGGDVSEENPLPATHNALDDATDSNTGIYIKPATGAIFTISGDAGTDTDVYVVGSVLPTGASTSANQTIENAYLYKLSESVDTDTRVKTNANLQVGDADVTSTHPAPVYEAELNEWTTTDTCASDTTVTTTKAASETDLWVLTDVSGGGTQNGYLIVEINDVEVWRLYFPANGSVGQKVHLSGSANQKIEGVIVMTAAGNGAVNIRGYAE